MSKKFMIVGRTNGWIAQRDSLFKGKEEIIIERDLSLREAQRKLLDMFNEDYETAFTNWGHARRHDRFATVTKQDGTRLYEYDSRYFSIEEQTED